MVLGPKSNVIEIGIAQKAAAKKDIKIVSAAGSVHISTPNELRLTAGGCQIKMSGGAIDIKAPGPSAARLKDIPPGSVILRFTPDGRERYS
jgi:hypothetical protein